MSSKNKITWRILLCVASFFFYADCIYAQDTIPVGPLKDTPEHNNRSNISLEEIRNFLEERGVSYEKNPELDKKNYNISLKAFSLKGVARKDFFKTKEQSQITRFLIFESSMSPEMQEDAAGKKAWRDALKKGDLSSLAGLIGMMLELKRCESSDDLDEFDIHTCEECKKTYVAMAEEQPVLLESAKRFISYVDAVQNIRDDNASKEACGAFEDKDQNVRFLFARYLIYPFHLENEDPPPLLYEKLLSCGMRSQDIYVKFFLFFLGYLNEKLEFYPESYKVFSDLMTELCRKDDEEAFFLLSSLVNGTNSVLPLEAWPKKSILIEMYEEAGLGLRTLLIDLLNRTVEEINYNSRVKQRGSR